MDENTIPKARRKSLNRKIESPVSGQPRIAFRDLSNVNEDFTDVSDVKDLSKTESPSKFDLSWTERTEVITKERHESYRKYSEEIIEDIVSNVVLISHSENNEYREPERLRSEETDSGSEYESATDEGLESSPQKTEKDAGESQEPKACAESSPVSIPINQQIKGALDLLKSFENLGVSSPRTSRASIEKARNISSNPEFNPFNSRKSTEPVQNRDSFTNTEVKDKVVCEESVVVKQSLCDTSKSLSESEPKSDKDSSVDCPGKENENIEEQGNESSAEVLQDNNESNPNPTIVLSYPVEASFICDDSKISSSVTPNICSERVAGSETLEDVSEKLDLSDKNLNSVNSDCNETLNRSYTTLPGIDYSEISNDDRMEQSQSMEISKKCEYDKLSSTLCLPNENSFALDAVSSTVLNSPSAKDSGLSSMPLQISSGFVSQVDSKLNGDSMLNNSTSADVLNRSFSESRNLEETPTASTPSVQGITPTSDNREKEMVESFNDPIKQDVPIENAQETSNLHEIGNSCMNSDIPSTPLKENASSREEDGVGKTPGHGTDESCDAATDQEVISNDTSALPLKNDSETIENSVISDVISSSCTQKELACDVDIPKAQKDETTKIVSSESSEVLEKNQELTSEATKVVDEHLADTTNETSSCVNPTAVESPQITSEPELNEAHETACPDSSSELVFDEKTETSVTAVQDDIMPNQECPSNTEASVLSESVLKAESTVVNSDGTPEISSGGEYNEISQVYHVETDSTIKKSDDNCTLKHEQQNCDKNSEETIENVALNLSTSKTDLEIGNDNGTDLKKDYRGSLDNENNTGDNEQPEFEDITQPESGDVTQPESGVFTQPESGVVTQPESGDVTRPELGDVTRPELGDVTQPKSGVVTQPESGVVTQPESGVVTQPESGVVTQPESGVVTQPESGVVSQPESGVVTQPESGVVTQPESGVVTQPESGVVTQPESGVVTQPESGVVTQPESRDVTQPELGDVTQPESGVVTQPESGVVTQPESGSITQPESGVVTQPESGVVTRPELDVTQSDSGVVTQPESGVVTQPESDDATQPESGDATQPESGDVTQPQSSEIAQTQPESGEITQPELNEITQPESNEITQPESSELTQSESGEITQPQPEITKPEESSLPCESDSPGLKRSDILGRLDDPNLNPFSTVPKVCNSPDVKHAKTIKDQESPCQSNEKDNKQNMTEHRLHHNDPQDKVLTEDVIADPHSVKVQESPLKLTGTECDPFKTKSQVFNSPCEKTENLSNVESIQDTDSNKDLDKGQSSAADSLSSETPTAKKSLSFELNSSNLSDQKDSESVCLNSPEDDSLKAKSGGEDESLKDSKSSINKDVEVPEETNSIPIKSKSELKANSNNTVVSKEVSEIKKGEISVDPRIDPFSTKSNVQNSPLKSSPWKSGNFEEIKNPFATKSCVQNSPIKNASFVQSPKSNTSFTLSKIDVVEENIDPFGTKSCVQNSPIKNNSFVQDNENNTTGTNLNSEDNKVDHFASKSFVQNSPIKNNSFVQSPKSNASFTLCKTDLIEDNVDPFATKSFVENSPFKNNSFVESLKNNSLLNGSNIDSVEDIVDPFATKSFVENSPVKNNSFVQCHKNNSSFNGSNNDAVQDIVDPFATKSFVENSPVKNNSFVQSPKNNSLLKGSNIDSVEDIVDPFATKSFVENSPIKNCSFVQSPKNNASFTLSKTDLVEEYVDPFATKSCVQNSPIKNNSFVQSPKSSSLLNGSNIDSVEHIVDPFATKSCVQNSPVKKGSFVQSPKSNTSFTLSKTDVVEDNKLDPFVAKSCVQNSPIKNNSFVQDEINTTVTASKTDLIEENIDPFATKSDVQNSPIKNASNLGLNGDNKSASGNDIPNSDLNIENINDIQLLPSDDYIEDKTAKDDTSLSAIPESLVKETSQSSKNSAFEITVVSTLDGTLVSNDEDFAPVPAKDIDQILDSDAALLFNIESPKIPANHELRKSISSIEFDVIAKQASDLTLQMTQMVDATLTEEEVFSDANAFFNNDEELDNLEVFGQGDTRANLARNSLFVKFDPLVAACMDNDIDPRRISSLMSFSPLKKQAPNFNESVMAAPKASASMSFAAEKTADRTLNSTMIRTDLTGGSKFESTFLNSTASIDLGTANLVSLADSVDAAVQTEVDVVSADVHSLALMNCKISYQDELLRKTREFTDSKTQLTKSLKAKEEIIQQMTHEKKNIMNVTKQFQDLMKDIIDKKAIMEKELEDQINQLKEEKEAEVSKLQKDLKQSQEEYVNFEKCFVDLVNKQQKTVNAVMISEKNNKALQEENRLLKESLETKKDSFVKGFKELEATIIKLQKDLEAQQEKYDADLGRANMTLKRAEMKILSQKQTIDQKDQEIRGLSSLLDGV